MSGKQKTQGKREGHEGNVKEGKKIGVWSELHVVNLVISEHGALSFCANVLEVLPPDQLHVDVL